jgi:hypothetical protein
MEKTRESQRENVLDGVRVKIGMMADVFENMSRGVDPAKDLTCFYLGMQQACSEIYNDLSKVS